MHGSDVGEEGPHGLSRNIFCGLEFHYLQLADIVATL